MINNICRALGTGAAHRPGAYSCHICRPKLEAEELTNCEKETMKMQGSLCAFLLTAIVIREAFSDTPFIVRAEEVAAESGLVVVEEKVSTISNETETNSNTTAVPNATGYVMKGSLKKAWDHLDWIEWIVPGPVFTILSTIVLGYVCGPSLAVAAFAFLVGTDVYVLYFSP